MNIDWQDVRYFLAIADAGSLSAAAARLSSSQPTLSRRLDALEAVLGFRLFKRHSRGLDLTQEGTLLLEQARQMMLSAVNIERLANGEAMQPEGTIRLALPEGICNEVVVPALGDFQRDFPRLRLNIAVSPRPANLIQGEADIAVRLFRPEEPDLVVKRLGGMALGLYASEQYLEGHRVPNSEAELRHHACIGYGDGLDQLTENRWLLERCTREHMMLRSDSTSCRLKATLSGLGISIQPDIVAAQHSELVALLPDARIPRHEIWLTYHKDLARSYRTRVVADMLGSILSKGLEAIS